MCLLCISRNGFANLDDGDDESITFPDWYCIHAISSLLFVCHDSDGKIMRTIEKVSSILYFGESFELNINTLDV